MKKVLLTLLVLFLVFPPTAHISTVFAAGIPEAQADKGLIVFYREKKSKGAALRFQISDGGGVSVGNLSNGSTFHVYLEPGQHTFRVRAPSLDGSDSVTLNVVAGGTYFLQGEILWGWPTGRPKFNQVSETIAASAMKKL